MTTAADVDWDQIHFFKPHEFPEGELELAHPALLYDLRQLRDLYKSPIEPSRVKGALARTDGSETSRHYAVDRLSDAVDIFPMGDPLRCWQLAVTIFNGVGIYYDTKDNHGKDRVMLHVDRRPNVVWWCRIAGQYHTVGKSAADDKLFYHWLWGLTNAR